MLRYGALRGPILIEVHGSQVALGRGIASKVVVEEME
jgi:Fe2+ transport system protein FeoA